MDWETNNDIFEVFRYAELVSAFKNKHKVKLFFKCNDGEIRKLEVFTYDEEIKVHIR